MWGQKWVEAEPSLGNLDPGLLMWEMRRSLDPTPMPAARRVIAFHSPDQPEERRHWWLIVDPGAENDLCLIDPGFDVDLHVETDLRCMTAIGMGLTTVPKEMDRDRLALAGPSTIEERPSPVR